MRKKSKYDMPAVQNFAFGGIANPSQRPFLRGSDKMYLNERQKELDAFEEQRQAYNTALQDWQTNVYNPYTAQVSAYNAAAEKYNTDVYNPYKAQVEAYNTAAQQYTTDVYNPYKTQYDEYVKAVEAYNAGDRTADYAGPGQPTLASTFDLTAPKEITAFDMTAPTAPSDFSMAAPSLPFKEEDIVKYQQEAGDRARRDASGRAVAIDVVSNPDQFNFGSMSVSNRFMARGGPVMKDMEPGDEEDVFAREAERIRDEELANSPSEEYDRAILSDYARRIAAGAPAAPAVSAAAAPTTAAQDLTRLTAAAAPAPAAAATPSEQVLDLRFQPKYRLAMEQELAASPSEEYDRAILNNYARATAATPTNTAAQQLTNLNNATTTPVTTPAVTTPAVTTPAVTAPAVTAPAVTAPASTAAQQLNNLTNATTTTAAPTNTISSVPVSQATSQITVGQPTSTSTPRITNNNVTTVAQPSNVLTAAIARDLMYRSMATGVPTSEFDKYGGYAAVKQLYEQGGGTYTGNEISADDKKKYATQIATTGVGNLSLLGETKTQLTQAGIDNMRKNGIDEATIANAIKTYGVKGVTPLTTKSPATVLSSVMPSANWNLTPSTYRGATATGVSGYSGPIPSDFRSILSATPVGWDGTSLTPKKPDGSAAPGGGGLSPSETTPITASSVPMFDYTSRGVGSAINNISIPTFNIGQAKEYVKATNPSNYFNIAKPGAPGISAGTTALGPADMPVASALTTLGTIGANKNLTPTMLGGMDNAGYRVDRLGNRIYAPAAKPLYGFAKGGDVNMADIMAMNTETLSDEKPEEVILTNPVGTAQKFLADLSSAGKTSPTRQSIKRTKTSAGGGATAEKAMQMAYEDIAKGDLGAMKDRPPAMKNTESARAQMEELARVYQMKIRSAQNAARGLSADTFGAPTLEQPTLTKGSLTKKRFKDGGEAKKDEGSPAPEVTGVNRAIDFIAQRMPADSFPTSARTLLETVQGKKEPITESNFSPKELNVLRQLIESTGGRGNVQYDDYTNFMKRQQQEKGTIPASIAPNVLSMLDPIGNVQTTLGRFTYASDADGNLVVTDKYDFNPIRSMSGAYGALRNYAAEKIPPGKGREVKINLGKPVKRAEGSPPEGELSQEEIDAASRPAFVTPKSGRGRKQGEISKQLKSGDAYVNMAKGVTELPYDIAGAPVDLATMLLRPFGYSTEKPVMGSDFIKEKMTKLGVRPEPPADPTSKGFYTAGELLSNLTNPAAVSRKVGPVVEKGVKAGAMEVGRQLDRAILDDAGPLSKFVPQAAKPLYAVRPSGSTMLSGPVGMKEDVSGIDKILSSGVANATRIADQNEGQANILRDFWDKKARNYFTRQFGTPDDPIARGIANKQIKGTALEEAFPEYLIDQIAAGKTRVKEGVRPEGFVGPGTPESRFFPKYPRAMDDFTRRYDEATNLKGNLLTSDPAAVNPQYGNILSEQGKQLGRTAQVAEEDKMLAQGLRPELINANVEAVGRSLLDSDKIAGYGTSSAEDLFKAYKEASLMNKMDKPQKTNWINQLFGEGRKVMGKTEDEVVKNMLPENIMTAINKGEPVYDMQYGLQKPLQAVFDPISINKYLASIPPREAANIRFEDAVKGGLKMREQLDQRAMLVDRIKSGKPVADTVFAKGVSAPLLQFDEGPFKGFAWKRIEKREATIPEGAYVGHSVGGYETGGIGYPSEKMEGFNTGKYQVYTLRDNRNRPVNTIEVQMVDEFTPVVMQIKGNGRASGNVPAEKYDSAVLQFFQDYLRPAAVKEKDELLTPLLKTYKEGVNSTFKMP
jgi:hypothetical protein